METFTIQQKATIWAETYIEAETLDEAMAKASEQMDEGDYHEVSHTWEFTGDYWATNENGDELELPEEYK